VTFLKILTPGFSFWTFLKMSIFKKFGHFFLGVFIFLEKGTKKHPNLKTFWINLEEFWKNSEKKSQN